MILDVVDPTPRILNDGGNIVIYVVISVLVALCIIIALKVINKKGSDKNEKE
jgi:hypothetical protein